MSFINRQAREREPVIAVMALIVEDRRQLSWGVCATIGIERMWYREASCEGAVTGGTEVHRPVLVSLQPTQNVHHHFMLIGCHSQLALWAYREPYRNIRCWWLCEPNCASEDGSPLSFASIIHCAGRRGFKQKLGRICTGFITFQPKELFPVVYCSSFPVPDLELSEAEARDFHLGVRRDLSIMVVFQHHIHYSQQV